MAAISGTCNLIHPDAAQRDESISRLQILIEICRELGTSVVTLCTGTRDPSDIWRAHPQNDSLEAWRDLHRSLERLLPLAENHHITLGIEPEPANVISSAPQARRLLNEMSSPSLRIVFDAANLVEPHGLSKQREILQQAFELLGDDIVLAHAKDLAPPPSAAQNSNSGRGSAFSPSLAIVAAGKGKLDYGLYVSLLQRARFNGPLILHNLTEAEAPQSIAFLREIISLTLEHTQANALFRPR